MTDLVFGRYEKIRRLAEGGMGEVFLARQRGVEGFERLVILKSLKAELAQEHGFVEQFLDEARVAATLNHPNIVALFEVGQWGQTYCIAMEYIAGEDLSRLWYAAAKKGVGLPFQVSVRIAHDACLGLDHAHHASDVRDNPLHIVHRDVSPQNIMVRTDGVTKLVDFGIAKAANKVSITATGTVKGKLQYMSPEQVRGEPVDARSDQFSLGIVLWEMCTGKRLFKADSELSTLNKILQVPIPTPSEQVPGFPAELERMIMRMLERERDKRYARCFDAAREMRSYLDRAAQLNGEVTVAEFVDEILGAELRARTKDLRPAPPDEGAGQGLAAAKTLERPAPAGGLLVQRVSERDVMRLEDRSALHQWILSGELGRDDVISEDGASWQRAGDVAELTRFFRVAEEADKEPMSGMPRSLFAADGVERDVTREQPSAFSELYEPPTVSEEQDAVGDDDDGVASLVTQPAVSLPLPIDEGANPSLFPPPPLEDDDDDDGLALAQGRRGGGRYLLAGAIGVLALALGALWTLDRPRVEAVLRAATGGQPTPTAFDAAVFDALSRDEPRALEEQRRRLSAQLDGREAPLQVNALLALLEVADARRAEERARLLRALHRAAEAQAAATQAEERRLKAYKLASRARAQGPLAEAHLAMAAYQAERGAVLEMEADLAGLDDALVGQERKGERHARLLAEALVQRAVATAVAARRARGPAVSEAEEVVARALEAAPGDARLLWERFALRLHALSEDGAPDAAAAAALLEDSRSLPRLAGDEHERAKLARELLAPLSAAPEAGAPPDDDFEERLREAKAAHDEGKAFEAARLYRHLSERAPERVEPWMGAGWAYIDLGKGPAAVRAFSRAARMAGAPPEATFGLAEAHRFAGEKRQALRSYRRYLRLSPRGPEAHVARSALAALEK